jgi:hypothetical protein
MSGEMRISTAVGKAGMAKSCTYLAIPIISYFLMLDVGSLLISPGYDTLPSAHGALSRI